MGLFGSADREGAGSPLPRRGLRRLVMISGTHFWKLIGANLLFVLFSLPVITLPAALCALNRVCLLIYREGNCFLWTDFFREFRRSFWRSLLPGALFGGLDFLGYFLMSLGAANGAFPVWCLLFWSTGILASAAGIVWGAYFFVLAALLDQKNGGVLKNAFLLCMIRPGRALAVLAAVLGAVFAAMALMPIFIIALVLFWFSLTETLVCYLVHGPAEQYVLYPEGEGEDLTRPGPSGTDPG